MLALTIGTAVTVACAGRISEPANPSPGTPRVSWIIMSGDRDNADQNFVCQSNPRNDCVMPVSRPDADVFSAVYVYYHGAGGETTYSGSIQIGFFRGSDDTRTFKPTVTVRKTESISNQSLTAIVTSTPGTYAMTFTMVATSADSGASQPIREQVDVVVK